MSPPTGNLIKKHPRTVQCEHASRPDRRHQVSVRNRTKKRTSRWSGASGETQVPRNLPSSRLRKLSSPPATFGLVTRRAADYQRKDAVQARATASKVQSFISGNEKSNAVNTSSIGFLPLFRSDYLSTMKTNVLSCRRSDDPMRLNPQPTTAVRRCVCLFHVRTYPSAVGMNGPCRGV